MTHFSSGHVTRMKEVAVQASVPSTIDQIILIPFPEVF